MDPGAIRSMGAVRDLADMALVPFSPVPSTVFARTSGGFDLKLCSMEDHYALLG